MLKPLVPKFRSDLSVRLKDIAEKQVPVKLKPIVGIRWNAQATTDTFCNNYGRCASSRIFLRHYSKHGIFARGASSGCGVGGD